MTLDVLQELNDNTIKDITCAIRKPEGLLKDSRFLSCLSSSSLPFGQGTCGGPQGVSMIGLK
jgi:hypothetical protein